MTTTYTVRVYCEDEGEFKYTEQTDTVDDTWVPDGCETHTLRDFAIIKTVVE